ncbi:MAG: prephenate dehydrogenase/arogenate dehydrogenase family protein [Clostridiales bacterium]|jgi:prephenate dehydrogenase|nr:prephenate dehydrogenase/arogenate dehydrogenase family protein [Clostridiales bacterium]
MVIGIVGLGLIGGSLGKALKAKTAHRVLGRDISEQAFLKAELVGAVDGRLTDSNYPELDVLIYAVTPVAFVGADGAEKIAAHLKDGAVVMDLAGTKSVIVNEMNRLAIKYPQIEFVSAHPMAGKENSGIEYSSAALFEHASVLLVPVKAGIETLARIKEFFLEVGFDYVRFTHAKEHDKIIAYTSQLPHVISSCYIGSPTAELHSGFSAGSFRDISRVAKMSAGMWAELFTENGSNLISELDGMIERLTIAREYIAVGDAEKLRAFLSQNSVKKESIDKDDRLWKKNHNEKK